MSITSMAVRAEPANYIKRKHNAVAFLDAGHGFSDIFDDAHNLVAHNGVLFQGCPSVVHMQITAANTASCYPQKSVRR